METRVIDIAADFTRFPAGRFRTDGKFSGERFREDILIPALEAADSVVVQLDGTLGYGSSFLEEVFGGLVRHGFSPERLLAALKLESRDRSLIDEITEYITATRH